MTTILLVGDLLSERIRLTDIIKKKKYTVIEAINGKKALEVLETFQPKLILTDYSYARNGWVGINYTCP